VELRAWGASHGRSAQQTITGLVWLVFALTSCGKNQSALDQAATIAAATIAAINTTIAPTSTAIPTATLEPTPTSTPPPTATPLAGGGRIAFISNRYGQQDLFTIRPDRSDLNRLTETSSDEWGPSWSPDGSQLAYAYYNLLQPIETGVYLINSGGSASYQLVGKGWGPSWSPDGQRLIFGFNPCRGSYCLHEEMTGSDLRLISAEGGSALAITGNRLDHSNPDWSPDGKQITYEVLLGSWPVWNIEIYLTDEASSDEVRFTTFAGDDVHPAWSPDGQRLAFSSSGSGNHEIQVINLDGTGLTRLTEHIATDWQPTWSPDGRWIAFASDRSGNFDLYLLELESGQLVQLTDDPGDEAEPDWSSS